MTSDETSADVIEQAAQVVFDYKPAAPMVIARALHAAHLLADPADRDEAYRKGFYAGADAIIRDELADPADKANEAFTWRERALHWKADKERAEAEVTELRATVERVRALINDAEAASLRHHANGDFTWVIEITALNAALDGAGESE